MMHTNMIHPARWRETCDPFALNFHNFELHEVLGYEGNGSQLFVFEAPIDLLSFTAKKRTLQRSEVRLNDLDRLFKRIYEDMVCGTLSESRFKMLSEDYEKEQEELRQKIALLEEEIQNQEDQVENVDKFIRQVKKYLHLEKLTPTVMNDMVNAVYVHAPDKSSGHRVQDVDISYNYIGILSANLLYDIINGKAA